MILYLASPYTDNEPALEIFRYVCACQAAAALMQQGHTVFSPIAHSHGIARFIQDHSHEFWMEQDLPFLDFADKMVVLTLPGWEKSKGIKRELEYAKDKGIPVEFKSMDDIQNPNPRCLGA